MKGKAGLVVGIAVGYVLGTRAGRERYDQIKTQWLKVWNTAPVQKQVGKATELAKTAALSLPSTLWDSAVKVTKAATSKNTPGEKLDAAIKASEDSVSDVEKAAKTSAKAAKSTVKAAKDAVDDAVDDAQGRGGA